MQKTLPARIKAAGTEDGLAEGQFRALVSAFNNQDSMGDVIVPGAFTDTLKEWEDSGDVIPVYWSHQMSDPDFNVGWVDSAQETEDGLEVVATLDLDPEAPSKAKQVYRLLKGRRVTQFSFAYDVLDGGPVEKDGESYNELRKLKLYELGPTPIGANQETELLAVKQIADDLTHGLKRGRVLSAKNESTLRDAMTALTGCATSIKNVLASVASTGDDEGKTSNTQEKASETGSATTQEPAGATVQEPTRRSPVNALAAELRLMTLKGTAS
jgi:HK97 family phage prohead protease